MCEDSTLTRDMAKVAIRFGQSSSVELAFGVEVRPKAQILNSKSKFPKPLVHLCCLALEPPRWIKRLWPKSYVK